MQSLTLVFALLAVFSPSSLPLVSGVSVTRNSDVALKKYYSGSHSLGNDYVFDSREWQTVNATDLDYKYPESKIRKRASSSKAAVSKGGAISHLINEVWNGLKGLGSTSKVEITWYTGHDLLNPSCWSNPNWNPTDESMVSALTAEGWETAPKCFKFLELCNGSTKCIFVRVVDSCAGCAVGSKHVDLTKAAFTQLASLDEGVLNVQMRPCTEPTFWFLDLWGPQ